MQPDSIVEALCILIPCAPALVFAVLTVCFLVQNAPSERQTAALVTGGLLLSLLAIVGVEYAWWIGDQEILRLHLGNWFGRGEYGFEIAYQIDHLSATVLPLVGVIALLVARFAVPYMHREPGFTRFFIQLSLFAAGMFVVVMAGSADLLMVGWECVGLASALLVTFFHERSAPPRAATRVFTTYRLCDVGLLVGTMMLHVIAGSADFIQVFGATAWPGGAASLSASAATAMASAFALAAIGKSAQFPLGNWLPRAMEGPTPSSAVFYGGPAVHAGVYLLLRIAPLLQAAPFTSAVLVGIGLVTAVHASILCRVQCDQKSLLAYATMTQLGLMVAECGLGWWDIARWHLVCHVCLRTYQLLRAPSALRDAHVMRASNHGEPFLAPELAPRVVSPRLLRWAYHLGLERTHIDTLIERWVVHPVIRLGQRADHFERRALRHLRPPQQAPSLPTEAPHFEGAA